MKQQLRNIYSGFFCMLLVSGFFTNSLAGVLCVSDGGHLKVETVCRPCCTEDDATCRTDAVSSPPDRHESCSNCTDLPLVEKTLAQRLSVRTTNIDPLYVNPSPGMFPAPDYGNLSTSRNVMTVDRRDFPQSIDLSTTVLRC